MGLQSVRNFGKVQDAIEVSDLVAVQKSSYEHFLQRDVAPTRRKRIGLEALFHEIFPVQNYDKSMYLEYLYYELEKPRYVPNECRQLRLTYGYPLKVCCRLRTKDDEDLSEQAIYLGEMPVMIGGGEFIINGAERVIVSQLHRSPGVDFLIESKEGDRVLHGGRIIPERGSWIEIGVTHKDILVVKIDQSSKIPATIFLRATDPAYGTNEEILRLFYPTKTVPTAKLTPAMWAVGPIVDSETGEIIVKAGGLIGDKVTLIQSGNITMGGAGSDKTARPDDVKEALLKFRKKKKLSGWFDVPDDKEIRSLLKKNPLALVIAVLCMRLTGNPYREAVNLEKGLGGLDVEDIAGRSVEEVKKYLSGQSARGAAEAIIEFCKVIVKKYGGRTEAFWENRPAREVIDEFGDIRQVGSKIRPLIANMLQSKSDVLPYAKKFPDPENIDISTDRHVCRAMAKIGLVRDKGILNKLEAEKDLTETQKEMVRRIGRELHSEGPWELDAPLWEMGRKCKKDSDLKKWREEYGLNVPSLSSKNKGDNKVEVIEQARDTLILNTLAEDDCQSHEQALLKFYMRLRPGNPPSQEKAKTFFAEKFSDSNRYRLGRVGRFRLNRKFEQNIDENEMTLRPEDFLSTMKYIMALRNNEGTVDDIDHLGNRRLRTIEELAGDEIRKGLLKLRKTVQERMSMRRDAEEPVRIADLVNSKSVSSSINYFFGRGELSQVVDQTNALSQLTHERRLSALGPGGLNRRRAGFEVRDVHISHYGRVCPIETPEGTNIGLIASLAVFATIDEYGFLLTPYRKVKNGKATDKVDYLRADEDMKAVIGAPNTFDQETNEIQKGMVLAMKHGELAQVDSQSVEYVDVSAKQIVGVSASLIPFLEHDDANRALMGSNMQRQAVPLLKTEAPLVGTGMEKVVGQNSSMVVKAKRAGAVTEVDSQHIVINHTDEYKLEKFVGLNERTCLNQKPIVRLEEKVEKGQIMADGGGTAEGVLSLGKNVLVGFVSFDGFNFEDAIVVSEKFVKNDSFTSIHIDEFTAEVRETRLGSEEFTCDIPNVGERALRNLDEHGVIREGTRVCPGDILVGKVVPKSKTELTPEEKLLHAIFGRAGEDVKNDSLELPSGYEGVVIKTELFTRRGVGGEEQKKALKTEIKEYEKQIRTRECLIFRQMIEAIHKKFDVIILDPSTRQKVGESPDDEVVHEQVEAFDIKWVRPASVRENVQKIVDRFWVKILEVQEEKNRRIERLKRGDELPSGVLEMVKVYVATKRTLSVGDKIAGRHGNKGVIAKIMPEEDMPFLEDGTSLDILLNPLGVPSRMNVGQILETHLGWVAKVLGFTAISPVFDGATEDDIRKLTVEANELMRQRKTELEEGIIRGAKRKIKDVAADKEAKNLITSWMRKNLQCIAIPLDVSDEQVREFAEVLRPLLTPKEQKTNESDIETVLGYLEDRLMVEFPDKTNPKSPVAPYFNRDLPIDKPEKIKDVWQKNPPKRLIQWVKDAVTLLKSDSGVWSVGPGSAPKQPGIYVFRKGSTRSKIVYVGIASKSLHTRLGQHWGGNVEGSGLRWHIWLDKVNVTENKQAPPDDEFFINVPKTLKTQLYDGRTGEPFDQAATIGYIYMMKLHHLVDDKIHARATGPYSLITQQPLGGKTRTGGQRFGEMEVWALEGYGAAYTLQEMLTVKSDDIEGRTKIYESMVKGQNSLEAGTPLSFDVLCNEIRGLGLNIQLEKKRLGGMAI